MASAFGTISTVGLAAAPSSFAKEKRLSASEKLSSLASISSSSVSARTQSVRLQKKHSSKIRAMAKELYFNKDGSAIKKLQVLFLKIINKTN